MSGASSATSPREPTAAASGERTGRIDRVTLAIPFHRGVAYLRQAIASVLGQGDPSWELLVVDDGERGEARETLDALGLGADERVHCSENARNLGMVGCWNRCLELARTDLVTLLHADDLLAPHYVALMRTLLHEHPEATAAFCAADIVDAHGTARFSFADQVKRLTLPPSRRDAGTHAAFVLQGADALRRIMAANFIMCPTLCLRRSRLGTRRFDPAWQQVQDLDLTTRLLMDGDALVGTRSVAYRYRRHARGATALNSQSGLRFDEEFALFDRVAARAEQLGWHGAARVARRKLIVRLHLLYRALGDALHLRGARALAQARAAVRGRAVPDAPGPGRRAG